MEKVAKKFSVLLIVMAAAAFGMIFTGGLQIFRDIDKNSASVNAAPLFVEGNGIDRPSSFVELAKMANPAVVNVTATTKGVSVNESSDIFDYFFGREPNSGKRTVRGFGSGFLISKDGYILTNYHVVSNQQSKLADDIKVKLINEEVFKAKVVGADSLFDVALLKINAGDDLPFLKLGDSGRAEVGEWVMAIGNPSLLEHTVTVGVVSAKGRQLSGAVYRTFIQTDAAINQGNSGGPLVNMHGEAIGINSMIIYGTEGIGFAIPINEVKEILPKLKEKGFVERGYIGILPAEITSDLKKSLDLPVKDGVFVQSVTAGSAAEKAGIREGDIIVSFDGKKISGLEDLYRIIGNSAPGKKFNIEYIRNGKNEKVTIVPDLRPSDDTALQSGKDNSDENKIDEDLGISVQPVSEKMVRYYNVPEDVRGVIISKVSAYSPAADAGLREGMIIRRVNRNNVDNVRDFYKEIAAAMKKSSVIALYIAIQDESTKEWISRYVTINLAD
jgi:serine protease Do